jgi:hypothetical protein
LGSNGGRADTGRLQLAIEVLRPGEPLVSLRRFVLTVCLGQGRPRARNGNGGGGQVRTPLAVDVRRDPVGVLVSADRAASSVGLLAGVRQCQSGDMGDAALGLAVADLADPPKWAAVRNMSDPVIN